MNFVKKRKILLYKLQEITSDFYFILFRFILQNQINLPSLMKKRKTQDEHKQMFETNNEEIKMQKNVNGNQQQQKNPTIMQDSIMDQKLREEKVQQQQTCMQSLREKVELYWVSFLDYMQFDRILSKRQFQLLRREDVIIKTKYPQNYSLTYQQRSESFGITLEQIAKIKKQQEDLKNKNFWGELKRFICCQGGNQLQEVDEQLTAASESQFFYLDKYNRRDKNDISITEEPLCNDKGFTKMFKEQNHFQKQNYNTKEQAFQDDIILDNKESQKSSKQTNSNKNKTSSFSHKQIDMDKIKTIGKKQSENKQSDQQANQINHQKKQKLQQQHIQDDEAKQSGVKNTQKVYIQQNKKANTYIQQLNIKESHKFNFQDPIDQISLVNDTQNIQKTDRKALIDRKQSRTTISDHLIADQSRLDSQEPRKQSANQARIEQPKNDQSTKKLLTGNQSSPSKDSGKNINFDDQSANPSQFNIDDNDIMSVSQSESTQILDGLKMKKKNKRNKSKNPKEESQFNLKVIEPMQGWDQQEMQDYVPEKEDERKQHSASSQQLKKKRKRNLSNFQGFKNVIKEGNQEQDYENQSSLTIAYDQNHSTIMSASGTDVQLAKKKKARNKRLFDLKEERQDQVVIFPQDDDNIQDDDTNYAGRAHTIDVNGDMSSNSGTSFSNNIKKRKKTKKLKDLNLDGDDYHVMVIQGEEQKDSNMQQELNEQENQSSLNLKESQNFPGQMKAEKKRKKKARLREEIEKQQQQFDIVDLGEIN